MANVQAYENCTAYLRSQGIKFAEGNSGNRIQVSYSGLDNMEEVKVQVIFDDTNRTVALRSYNFVKFNESKKKAVYKACSEANAKFRWCKFYVDEDDNTITIEDDCVVDPENPGPEIYELVHRMVGIADDAYPAFMKAIYA